MKKSQIKEMVLKSWPFVLACIINFFLFVFVELSRGIVFETVDDFNVMYTIAGYKTGEPYFQLTFYNTILAFLTTIPYRLYDGVQWYAIFQLLMLYASFTTILWLILDKTKHTKSLIFAVLLYVVCFFSFMIYPIQRMQFTSSAAALGAASCAILFSIEGDQDSRKKSRMLLSILFLVLCFMERRMVSLCVICFWLLGIAILILISKVEFKDKISIGIKKVMPYVLGATILILVINTVDTFIKYNFDNAEYMEYDEYRGMYQDYNKPAYDEATELYQSVGWDQSVCDIVRSLVYIDENINKESFKTLVESSEFSGGNTMEDAVDLAKSLFETNPSARGCLLITVLVFLGQIIYALLHVKKLRLFAVELLTSVCACVGSFIICMYLCIEGRFLLRIFLTVATPALAVLLINFVSMIKKISDDNEWSKSKVVVAIICWVVFLTIGIYPAYLNMKYIYVHLQEKDSYSDYQMVAFEDYAAQHPENIYFHDYSVSNSYNSYNPFRIRTGEYPTNIIISGGSYTYTGCYYEQLSVNGLEKFTGETLFDENVYYVCDTSKSRFIDRVKIYLEQRYQGVTCEQIEVVGYNVEIYKFSKSE